MEHNQDIYQHLFIGIAVASVLLQTRRYGKAIELFNECWVLLERHGSEMIDSRRSAFTTLVYERLFSLYCLVGDHARALQSGEKAYTMHSQSGNIDNAEALLTKLFHVYFSARERGGAEENSFLEGMLLVRSGIKYKSDFDYSQAKDCFEGALAIWKEIGNRREEGKTLTLLSDLFTALKEYKRSKLLLERALVILEEAEDFHALGGTLSRLGHVCCTLGEYEKAKSLHKRALAISVLLKERDAEMGDYRNLAAVHAFMGEVDEARKCFSKAIAICKETSDKNGEAMIYHVLGGFYRSLNNHKEAIECFRHACTLFREIGDRDQESSEYSELGALYLFVGKVDEARKCHEKALGIKKEIGDRRGEGEAYNNLGCFYMGGADYGKAKECYERALAIDKETNSLREQAIDYGHLGTVHRALSDYGKAYLLHKKALELKIRSNENTEEDKESLCKEYSNMGSLCHCRGEYVKAKKFFKRALGMIQQMVDRRAEGGIFANLAWLELSLGEEEKSKQYREKALQLAETCGSVMIIKQVYGIMGNACKSVGDYSMAKEYHVRTLSISKRLGDKREEGSCYHEIGQCHMSLGDHRKAIEYYKRALAISEAIDDKSGQVFINNDMGNSYLLQGNYMKGEGCLNKALSIAEEIGDLEGKSTVLANLAGLCISRGKKEEAFSHLLSSVKIIDDMRGSLGESERYQIAFADKTVGLYRLMAAMLCSMKKFNLALSVSELGRARTLAELMAKQYSVKNLPGLDKIKLLDFHGMGKINSCLCLSYLSFEAYIIVWISKPCGNLVFKQIPLTTDCSQDVHKRVPDRKWIGSAADHTFFLFKNLRLRQCEDRSLSLLYESDLVNPPVELGGCIACRHLEEEEKEEKEREECHERSVLQLWYKKFIAPVVDQLKGFTEIVIVPDRSLYRVPFGALVDENGKYLSDAFRIRYVPSLTVLKLIQDSPANYHSQAGALVVGDPDVGTVMFQGVSKQFDRLPCAKREAEMIGELLHVQPLTEKHATKEAVLKKMKSASLIHIAAHGDAEKGDVVLAPDRYVTRIPQEEHFLLTMADVSKVQLRAKLVVLSCCHSGRGHIKAEGIVGIARAFLASGARSVLVSLWAVEDDATMQLMKWFYESLVCGKSASESLHKAMKLMREDPKYSEVRQWAPFMLVGDDVSFHF
ncbi:PREDICTED: tetratricopeptide repeat protein 28-like isoform X2 [Acropora digitifera]|uniref:tetratricopeptide repeat protein 28-like isoform X1 n=1 Tax=Acropora digitifera TaxID=70779 RepID=UPI00077AE124|nr:PREDICTED: tetratricopeptide repeat protein 28-like isoform X1 [Acropora digitifera]XP_015748446.1 PREDICTED: tetratricopeptide repeat protein 28-like isoform X2 [Acropora digitifera]